MERDRLGLIGGLVADRPILTSLLLAFGLTALTALGVTEGAPGATSGADDLVIAALMLSVAPLLIAAASPASPGIRAIVAIITAAASVAIYIYQPLFAPGAVTAMSAGVFVGLTWLLLAARSVFGAMTRFTFLAAAGAVVGMAGATGLMAQQGIFLSESAPAVTCAYVIAAIVGAGAVAEFSVLFASGADKRRAAGFAARRAIAPSVYGALAAALAFSSVAVAGGEDGGRLLFGGFAGLSAIFCALPAFSASAGALSLRQARETLAVEENRRRQAFRRFWRPFRRLFPPNASLAVVAIAAIALVAAAFNMPGQLPAFHLAFVAAGALAAGIVFFSLRVGLFVFFLLVTSSALAAWLWGVMQAPDLAENDQAASLALAAVLFGGLAATWRDARSPRLNPRETTEAAMTDALGEHLFALILAVTGFFAANAAGVWPGGLAAGGYLAVMAGIGLLLAPALMTSLSFAVRREIA